MRKVYRIIIYVCSLLILALVGIGFYRMQDAKWEAEDVYGDWKVTRLVGAYKGTKGMLPYGSNIGRTISITEKKITDSTDLEEAIAEADEQRCFTMNIGQVEETAFDLSESEKIAVFQIHKDMILDYVGFKNETITQFVFIRENDCEDYHMAPEFEVFSYNDKSENKILVDLPLGYYILEPFKEQKKGIEPYGRWMITYRLSGGSDNESDITFMNDYGQCFDIAEDAFGECAEGMSQVNWTVVEENKSEFEEENNIEEGLGLRDESIEIWQGTNEEGLVVQVIPVNEKEIIVPIDGQWFMLEKVEAYQELGRKTEDILTGDWKFVQLLATGEVDESKELANHRGDYQALWYTLTDTFDSDSLTDDAKGLEINDYVALEFLELYDVPHNITCLFEEDDILHTASCMRGEAEAVYIVIDEDTIIRGRNGLWYELEKVRPNERKG